MTLRFAVLGGAALALIAVFTVSPAESRFFPPCIFHSLTGFYCPGCGITRALHALLHGDLSAAWHYNALFVLLLPLLAAAVVLQVISLLRHNRFRTISMPTGAAVALLCVMVSFAVMRNLPFEWARHLAP